MKKNNNKGPTSGGKKRTKAREIVGASVNTRATKTWEMFKAIHRQRKANKKTVLHLLNWNHKEKSYMPLPELQGNPGVYVAVNTHELEQEVFGKKSGDTLKEL